MFQVREDDELPDDVYRAPSLPTLRIARTLRNLELSNQVSEQQRRDACCMQAAIACAPMTSLIIPLPSFASLSETQPAVASLAVSRYISTELIYLRQAPREEEDLIGNIAGRRSLAQLIRSSHLRAGRPVGQSMIVVMGASSSGKTHCINLALKKHYKVISHSSADFWRRREDSHESGSNKAFRRHLDQFLKSAASSHDSEGNRLAIILEEADELFSCCPKALDICCSAVIVATMSHICFSQDEKVYSTFKKLRTTAEKSNRLVRFWRPNRDESRQALLRLKPHIPLSVQNDILNEATGDFRQLALVEELFRLRREVLNSGSLTAEQVQTPFDLAKEVLIHKKLPKQLEDADYATGLVVINFHACCTSKLTDLEAMAAMAEEACQADLIVTAAYQSNNTGLVSETSRQANEVLLRSAALLRPNKYPGNRTLDMLPSSGEMRPDRYAGYTTEITLGVEALTDVVEAPNGLIPRTFFRKTTRMSKVPCVHVLQHEQARPIYERSWMGGILYDGENSATHFFPTPGHSFWQENPGLDENETPVDAYVPYHLDFAKASNVLGVEISQNPAL